MDGTPWKGGEKLKITLKAARVNAGLTQTAFAEALGVSKMTVCEWESGKRRVRPVYMPLIAQVTGVSMNDIILPVIITKSNKGGE